MSWFKVFILCLCLFAAAAVSSCGFEPLYAKKSIETSLPDIDIANIPDRDGQYLRNLLMDRLYTHGRPADALYQLKFSPLDKNLVYMGIEKNATATRSQMQIATHMELIETHSGKSLLQRDLKAVGAYNLLDNQLATLVSQQNTTESVLQELRDDALTELDLYFRRAAPAKP